MSTFVSLAGLCYAVFQDLTSEAGCTTSHLAWERFTAGHAYGWHLLRDDCIPDLGSRGYDKKQVDRLNPCKV